MTKTETDDKKIVHDLLSLLPFATKEDKDLITQAYNFAKEGHKHQKRMSGKPYFFHTLETARHLAELGMDATSIAAGFLHDTIEEECATAEEIKEKFGKDVLFLVEGVTKLGKLKYRGLERHAESMRKLFIAVAHDIRVIIIRLADRLHNIKTLQHLPEEKQKRIALETLEIYAPLAHRLGMGQLKGELEDAAFPYIDKEAYEETLKLRKQKSKEHLKLLKKIDQSLKRMLAEEKIKVVGGDYRIKRLYSLYKKLKEREMNIDNVYDIAALRIIVPTIEDCYRTLGIIHKRWKPLPGRIKDYIASPKPNGYQSLHTTIFTGDGGIVEIQVRTPEMHHNAEYGIASHMSYKGTVTKDKGTLWVLRMLASPFIKDSTNNKKPETPKWLTHLAETEEKTETPQEFLQSIKNDFFQDRTFVFTPKGEVIDLPVGSTAIDFAYAVHTDLGDHMAGAKINNKLTSIEKELGNGDIVEILTKESSRPTRKWLDHAKTTLARRHIRTTIQKTKEKSG